MRPRTNQPKPAGRSRKTSRKQLAVASTGTGDPIEHVVVLVLENRSFDQMLGSLKSLHPALVGIDPNNPGVNEGGGKSYPQTPTAVPQLPYGVDPKHELADVREQVDFGGAQCAGFIHDFLSRYPDKKASAPQVMAYFDRQGSNRLSVLHTLAESFAICDHWFCSVPGPTWPNRFFVHSGTSNGWVQMPAGFSHWHDYDQVTLYDRLNEQRVSWKIYFDDIPQSLMLTHQRRARNRARYERMSNFYADAKGPADKFPQYAFIEPCYLGGYENDQHPPANVLDGEVLIAKVYNALRANVTLWKKTLFVLLYDEHGGFYDQVYPPDHVTPPDAKAGDGFDFKRLGPRVPALLISPYAPKAVVPTVFDHTSLLRYLQKKWGLGPLGNRTAQAASFEDALLPVPRTDTPAKIPEPSTDPHPLGPSVAAPQRRGARAPAKARRGFGPAGAPAPGVTVNDLQSNLLAFTQLLEAEAKDSPAASARRAFRETRSTEGQIAVAKERVTQFLGASKPKTGRPAGQGRSRRAAPRARGVKPSRRPARLSA